MRINVIVRDASFFVQPCQHCLLSKDVHAYENTLWVYKAARGAIGENSLVSGARTRRPVCQLGQQDDEDDVVMARGNGGELDDFLGGDDVTPETPVNPSQLGRDVRTTAPLVRLLGHVARSSHLLPSSQARTILSKLIIAMQSESEAAVSLWAEQHHLLDGACTVLPQSFF